MARHQAPSPALLPPLPDTPVAIKRALARHLRIQADLLAHWADLEEAEAARVPPTIWLTPSEAAAQWGVHRETVRLWATQGRVRARRIGSAWRIDRDSPLGPKGSASSQEQAV